MKSWRWLWFGAVAIGGCGSVIADGVASGSTGASSASGAGGAGGAAAVTGSASATGGAGGFLVGSSGSTVGAGGGAFDAGVPIVDAGITPAGSPDACLARSGVCPIGEDAPPNLASDHLHEVLTECGSANGCPNGCFCGELTVSFDAQGCATALGYNSGLTGDVEACLVDHLNQERWYCGAGKVAVVNVPCTTRK